MRAQAGSSSWSQFAAVSGGSGVCVCVCKCVCVCAGGGDGGGGECCVLLLLPVLLFTLFSVVCKIY